MTYPINSIAGKKHRQLVRQVGGVAKINPSTSLMASFSFSIIAFIPGQDFHFGSFDFIANEDGRLRISNLEAIRSYKIRYDSDNSKTNLSDSNTTWIGEDWDTTLSFPFGLENASAICQKALQRDYALRFRYGMLSSSESDLTRTKGKTALPRKHSREEES